MTEKELNLWFNKLDLKALMRMFVYNAGRDLTDFVDDCDEYWDGLTEKQKEDFYLRHYEQA